MSFLGLSCVVCGTDYPDIGTPYCCPVCNDLFDYRESFPFDPARVDNSQLGIWRYRYSFVLPDCIQSISLGEGNTPLVEAVYLGHHVAFKCEYLNPTGSFKDRGSAIIVAWLRFRGASEVVEDSSGNAGASLAAYAARAGMRVRVFVPSATSGAKRRQIEAYGGVLVPVAGKRSDVADAVIHEAREGVVYASHAYLPFNLAGYATAAYEIFAQLGRTPGSIIVPAGQGGFLLGIKRGFDALRMAGICTTTPMLIGVQAQACAPLWQKFRQTKDALTEDIEALTVAEGIRVRDPVRAESVISAVKESQGQICTVEESDILPGRDALAHLGFYVEPTAAVVLPALAKIIRQLPEPIVVFLTGSGLKYG